MDRAKNKNRGMAKRRMNPEEGEIALKNTTRKRASGRSRRDLPNSVNWCRKTTPNAKLMGSSNLLLRQNQRPEVEGMRTSQTKRPDPARITKKGGRAGRTKCNWQDKPAEIPHDTPRTREREALNGNEGGIHSYRYRLREDAARRHTDS